MALRRDNNKWTFPGGHLDAGESPLSGAVRELWEEAGIMIEQTKLEALGRWRTTTYLGDELEVYPFRALLDGDTQTPSPRNDPDKEVSDWYFIETNGGMPRGVLENLHSPKNALLMAMGLQEPAEGIHRFCKEWPLRRLAR